MFYGRLYLMMALPLMMFLKFNVASFLELGNVNFSELKVPSESTITSPSSMMYLIGRTSPSANSICLDLNISFENLLVDVVWSAQGFFSTGAHETNIHVPKSGFGWLFWAFALSPIVKRVVAMIEMATDEIFMIL